MRPLERESALSEVEGWVVGAAISAGRRESRSFSSSGEESKKKKAGRLLDGKTWDEMPREMGLVKA